MTSTVTERRRLTVVRAAWLFDGIGATAIADPVIVLDGTTIVAVDQGIAVPEGADVVDLAGTTVLPGLIDTHVHLAFDASANPVGALAERDDDQARTAMADAGRAALRGGVTTVRDLGDRGYLSLDLRNTPGIPTIVAAGPPVTTPHGHCHFLGGVTEATERGVRAAIRERAERGCDVVKIMASGGTLTPGTRQEQSQFGPAELRAAVDEAHRHGLGITAHAHGTQAIADALDAGVDGMEHVSFWTEDGVDHRPDLIRAIADRRVVVGATVGIKPVPGAEPPPPVAARLAKLLANVRAMYQAGVPLVAGTDSGIGLLKPHPSLPYAVPQLIEFGMTAAEALRTITSVAAGVCGLAHRKGRLAPGFDADLLAVDGDPLADPTALLRVKAVYALGEPRL